MIPRILYYEHVITMKVLLLVSDKIVILQLSI
jgi:hypothetical protein